MIKAGFIALTLSLASPAVARDPLFALPLDCTLGQDCYIQAHVDTDPSEGAADFTCGPLSRDGHKGVDFALPSTAAMRAGVDVISTAPGKVLRLRDGVPDALVTTEAQSQAIAGKECGNAVVIGHGGGWESQYCHLQQGSISVKIGQRVAKGTPLGKVGLSGLTSFAHVHLSLRKDGREVDPFNPDGVISCMVRPSRQLWEDPIAYVPSGLIDIGFAPALPKYAAVTDGTAAHSITKDAGALVLWGFAFGGKIGDQLEMEITRPDGTQDKNTLTLEKSQPRYFRAFGKRRKGDTPWPTGVYSGEITLIRDGERLDHRKIEMKLEP